MNVPSACSLCCAESAGAVGSPRGEAPLTCPGLSLLPAGLGTRLRALHLLGKVIVCDYCLGTPVQPLLQDGRLLLPVSLKVSVLPHPHPGLPASAAPVGYAPASLWRTVPS